MVAEHTQQWQVEGEAALLCSEPALQQADARANILHVAPSTGIAPEVESLGDDSHRKARARAVAASLCLTPGCNNTLPKAKGMYCSEECYIRGCQAASVPPRTCKQPGCTNLSMPGEQSGTKCQACYAAHKLQVRQQAGQQGRVCALEGCGNVVFGDKPKYGQFCSLECGRASGKGRVCEACGHPDVFKGSQSGKYCLACYNREQTGRTADRRGDTGRGRGRGRGRGGGAKRRKVTEEAAGE